MRCINDDAVYCDYSMTLSLGDDTAITKRSAVLAIPLRNGIFTSIDTVDHGLESLPAISA